MFPCSAEGCDGYPNCACGKLIAEGWKPPKEGNVVVNLDQPISATEAERQRFERWASGALRGPNEASTLLARSRGGDYVLLSARAAWAAW